MIVVPAIPVTLTFFVFSCVILAYTVGGLAYFCEHALNYTDEAVNLTRYAFFPEVFKDKDHSIYCAFILAAFNSTI